MPNGAGVSSRSHSSVHAVRNSGEEQLAALVVHRPSFGQNWYVFEDEVDSEIPSGRSEPGGALPEGFFDGWELGPLSFDDGRFSGEAFSGDTLLLVLGGTGQLAFEDKTLDMSPGVFVRVPPTLAYSVTDGGQASIYSVRIPRPPPTDAVR